MISKIQKLFIFIYFSDKMEMEKNLIESKSKAETYQELLKSEKSKLYQ